MGGGSSRPPVDVDVSALPVPVKRADDVLLFSIIPQNDELKRKGDVLVLEVGSLGFRLLRPGTEDPVSLYPWGQIHSWAHGVNKFTFRYFDDGKRAILQHVLSLRDVDELLEHIQAIIDNILAERKKSGISPEAFEQLLVKLKGKEASEQLEMIKQAMVGNTFTTEQGRDVLDLLPTTFDKVEAATALHSKLIDQNRFGSMLEALDCQADRDNVWHRITAIKKTGPRRTTVSSPPLSPKATSPAKAVSPPPASQTPASPLA